MNTSALTLASGGDHEALSQLQASFFGLRQLPRFLLKRSQLLGRPDSPSQGHNTRECNTQQNYRRGFWGLN